MSDIRLSKQYQRGRLDGINGRMYEPGNGRQSLRTALYLAGFNIARGVDRHACMSQTEKDALKRFEEGKERETP